MYQLRQTYDAWLARAFPRLDPQALRRVTAVARPRRYGRGEAVIREGDLPRSCFVVAAGEVEVTRADNESARPVILGPGQFFGEVGLLRAVPRTATVSARTSVDVLELQAETLREIVEGSPETADDLDRIARERSSSR